MPLLNQEIVLHSQFGMETVTITDVGFFEGEVETVDILAEESEGFSGFYAQLYAEDYMSLLNGDSSYFAIEITEYQEGLLHG